MVTDRVCDAGWQKRQDLALRVMVVLVSLVLCNMVVSCSAIDCAGHYTKGSGVGFFSISGRSCKTSFVDLSDLAPDPES